jgi:starch phosphorylase
MDTLSRGFAGNSFTNIVGYLLYSYGISDPYMCLADFDSYFSASERMRRTYEDKTAWAQKYLVNIAKAGFFAADRSIREYAENIWHASPIV